LAIDFAEAARRVDQIVGNIEEKPFKPDINIDRRRNVMNAAWQSAKEPWVAYNYLVGRKIPSRIVDLVGTDIRGCEKMDLYDGKEYLGQHNAMLALIRNAKGIPISIHRTYLTADGKQKKIMPTLETITGACVRLGEPEHTLVLAEGIETALAGWALTGHPAWATISAHGLESFQAIPKHVQRVIVVADNDVSFTGQAAAFNCAKYYKQRLKISAEVIMPEVMGFDALNQLNELTRKKLYIAGGNPAQIGMMRWKA
jgi:hypothetical protein